MIDPIREKLMQLDVKAENLQKAGKYLECLEVFEEMLSIKKNAFGEDSEEYFKTSDKICELCNLIAMIFLQKEKMEACLDFLKKAEILSQSSMHYKAITFNNMACYYRRNGKLRIALNYLEQALAIEIKLSNTQQLADTHLNMCAVLSQLSKHEQALEHILLSVILLQDEFINNQATNSLEDRVSVLSIAYHNLGVELEYLKRFDEAIQTYNKAVNFAITRLGEGHQLVENLKNVLNTAIQQIEQHKSKEHKRRNDSGQKNQAQQKMTKLNGLYSNNQTANNFNKKKTTFGQQQPTGSQGNNQKQSNRLEMQQSNNLEAGIDRSHGEHFDNMDGQEGHQSEEQQND